MATKVQDAIIAMANGVINYVDVRIDNANYVRTDIGKVKSVALVNGKYSHTVTIRNYDYSGVFSLGNNEFSANSVVYLLIPSGQYNQMFILGHLDDTLAHIKGGDINLGNGNFVVDNSGNVTIKKGSINLGNGNFTVDNNGSVVIKSGNITLNSGSINLGNGNFVVNSSGVITVKTGSINLGNGNFVVDNSGSVTIKSGSINLGNNFVVTSAGAVTINDGSINLGNGNFIANTNGYVTLNTARFGNFELNSGNIAYYSRAVGNTIVGEIYGESGGEWGHSGILGAYSTGLLQLRGGTYGVSISVDDPAYSVGNISLTSSNYGTIYFNNKEYSKCLQQTNTTNNAEYRVLYSETADDTNRIEGARKGRLVYNPSSKTLYIGANTNEANFSCPATQKLYLKASTESDYGLFIGVVDSSWAVTCVRDNYMRLGSPSYRWNQVYATNATINTSDRNQKHDIELLEDKKTKNFIMDLKPVSFKFKNGESGRTHHGLIAQDVEDTLNKLNMTPMDFAGFCKDKKTEPITVTNEEGIEYTENETVENEYTYGLRYEEFIPSLIKMVQMLQTEIEELKNKIGE